MDDETLKLYRSMRSTELHVLHLAFMLDLNEATSADTKSFCLDRIRLVRQLLRERGAEQGVDESAEHG
jgi:hypothetical protein